MRCSLSYAAGVSLLTVTLLASAQAPATRPAPQGKPRSNNLGTDARGNPLRLAFKTGHVSNHHERRNDAASTPFSRVQGRGAVHSCRSPKRGPGGGKQGRAGACYDRPRKHAGADTVWTPFSPHSAHLGRIGAAETGSWNRFRSGASLSL